MTAELFGATRCFALPFFGAAFGFSSFSTFTFAFFSFALTFFGATGDSARRFFPFLFTSNSESGFRQVTIFVSASSSPVWSHPYLCVLQATHAEPITSISQSLLPLWQRSQASTKTSTEWFALSDLRRLC